MQKTKTDPITLKQFSIYFKTDPMTLKQFSIYFKADPMTLKQFSVDFMIQSLVNAILLANLHNLNQYK